MVTNEPDEGQHAADMIRDRAEQRAADALASAAATLAEPRPWAGAADEWARSVPLATPRTPPRAPAAIVHRTKMQEPASPASSDDAKPVSTGTLLHVLRGVIDGERAHAREQQEPLLARITDLESRLARAEARVAGLEAKKSRK